VQKPGNPGFCIFISGFCFSAFPSPRFAAQFQQHRLADFFCVCFCRPSAARLFLIAAPRRQQKSLLKTNIYMKHLFISFLILIA
jgi:hypothetical protein